MKKELIDLVKELRALDIRGQAYLSTIPYPFDMAMVDNEYQHMNTAAQAILMKAVFGDLYEDVYWFFYEWHPGFSMTTADGVEYVFNTEEDYYKYLETQ